MRRWWILVIALFAAGCSASPTAITMGSSSTTTLGAITSVSQTATSTMPVTTSISTPITSTTDAIVVAVPIDSVESGLFCRDLYRLGYGFRDAVAYWMSEGQTARMDADRNGVPCETVYKAGAVEAVYGSAVARGMHLATTVNYVDTPRFVVTGSAVRDGVICETGTAVAIEWPNGEWFWVDRYTCDDGSGTFVAGAEVRIGIDRLYEVWEILGGTGAYAELTGGGGANTGPAGEDLWQDHMYGRVEVPHMPLHQVFAVDVGSLYPVEADSDSGGANGSGCTTGGAVLPDGLWFGSVREWRSDEIVFDLQCFYSGDKAREVATTLGQEPHDGIIVTNDSTRLRTLPVGLSTVVFEIRQHTESDGDSYSIFVDVPYSEWPSPLGGYICGSTVDYCPTWVAINDGIVTEILEQYFP